MGANGGSFSTSACLSLNLPLLSPFSLVPIHQPTCHLLHISPSFSSSLSPTTSGPSQRGVGGHGCRQVPLSHRNSERDRFFFLSSLYQLWDSTLEPLAWVTRPLQVSLHVSGGASRPPVGDLLGHTLASQGQVPAQCTEPCRLTRPARSGEGVPKGKKDDSHERVGRTLDTHKQ